MNTEICRSNFNINFTLLLCTCVRTLININQNARYEDKSYEIYFCCRIVVV